MTLSLAFHASTVQCLWTLLESVKLVYKNLICTMDHGGISFILFSTTNKKEVRSQEYLDGTVTIYAEDPFRLQLSLGHYDNV